MVQTINGNTTLNLNFILILASLNYHLPNRMGVEPFFYADRRGWDSYKRRSERLTRQCVTYLTLGKGISNEQETGQSRRAQLG